MQPRDRLLGPIATRTKDPTVDFGQLIRSLVLSEEFILESDALTEFPLMVRKFGYDGVKELLDSKLIRVQCEATWPGSFGGVLPLGSYRFGAVYHPVERKELMSGFLRRIDDAPGLKGKQGQKLRKAVGVRLATPPTNSGRTMLARLYRDSEANSPVLKSAVAMAATRLLGRPVRASEFDLSVEQVGEEDLRTETNLSELFELDAQTVHNVVEDGLFAVAILNRRVELMERFEAVSGFQSGELPLFEDMLTFLARQLDPDVSSERFQRVVELADLPDVNPDPDVRDVDLARLVEIVQSDEASEFRRWLPEIDAMSEKDVEDQIRSLRDAVGGAIRSPTGKTIRWLTTTVGGLLLENAELGTVASGVDSFLLEKVIPPPGPTAFISRLYPSIFREAKELTVGGSEETGA